MIDSFMDEGDTGRERNVTGIGKVVTFLDMDCLSALLEAIYLQRCQSHDGVN